MSRTIAAFFMCLVIMQPSELWSQSHDKTLLIFDIEIFENGIIPLTNHSGVTT